MASMTPTLDVLTQRVAVLEEQAGLTQRQIGTMQGTNNFEPLSNIAGWALTGGFTDPTAVGGSTYVGQAQMILAGKGLTLSRPARSPFLQLAITNAYGCYDYVVASDGSGTHTTVRAMIATFLADIAAANKVNDKRAAWICSDDTDTNIEFGSGSVNVGSSALSIDGAGVAERPRHTLTATITNAGDAYLKSTQLYVPRITFKHLQLTTAGAGVTTVNHAFVSHNPGPGGVANGMQTEDCQFNIGQSAATFGAVFDSQNPNGIGTIARFIRSSGNAGMLYRIRAQADAGWLDLEDSRELTVNIIAGDSTGVDNQAFDRFWLHGGQITTIGYGLNHTAGSSTDIIISDITIRHTGSSYFLRTSSLQAGVGIHLSVSSVYFTQSNTGAVGFFSGSAATFPTTNTAFLDGIVCIADGVTTGPAVVLGANWNTAYRGDIATTNYTTGVSGTFTAASMHIIQEDGTVLPQEPALNFQSGLLAADSAGVSTTVNLGPMTALWNQTGNFAIQHAGDLRVAGYERVGSVSAPLNTTAGDLTVQRAFWNNDSNFSIQLSGLDPIMFFDSTDFLQYKRASNVFSFVIGGAPSVEFTSTAMNVYGHVVVGNTTLTTPDQFLLIAADATTPRLNFDANDLLQYDRTNNIFEWAIGGALVTELDGNGDLRTGGYLQAGSIAAPTNTADGDLTVTRLNIGNVAFPTGAKSFVLGETWLREAGVSSTVFATDVTGDTFARHTVEAAGLHAWGTGAAAGDVELTRGGVGNLDIASVPAGAITMLRLRGANGGTPPPAGTVATNLVLYGVEGANEEFLQLRTVVTSTHDILSGASGIGVSRDIRFVMGSTVALQIVNPNGVLMGGYLRVGAIAAPTNATAGDMTALRVFIGTDAALLAGLTAQVAGALGVSAQNEFRLYNTANTFYTAHKADASTRVASITYIWPSTDPTGGQVLTSTAPTAGVATLSWATAGGALTEHHTFDGIMDNTVASTTVPYIVIGPFAAAATITGIEAKAGSNKICGATSAIFDVHKVVAANANTDGAGTTIFTTQANRPTISTGNMLSTTTLPDVVAIAVGDYLLFYTDQQGTTLTDVTVGVRVTMP